MMVAVELFNNFYFFAVLRIKLRFSGILVKYSHTSHTSHGFHYRYLCLLKKVPSVPSVKCICYCCFIYFNYVKVLDYVIFFL
jgi:hypothetical protein